jgi:hypothetical protein
MIGREGEGPGEFQSPAVIAVSDTLIRVIESRLMRVQDYRPDGSHVADHVVPTPFLGAAALAIDGRIVLPTMGRDSSLAGLRTVADTTTVRLGPPVAPAPMGFDFTAMKAEMAEGRVPDQFRNQVTPVMGEVGIVWLIVQSESEIRKYSSTGDLVWTRTMDVPEVEQARRVFFRKNAEEKNPSRIYALLTIVSARQVADVLWVLMLGEDGKTSVIYILNSENGETRGRLSVVTPAPASGFAVDAPRKRLYVAVGDEASILTVDLAGVNELWQGGK